MCYNKLFWRYQLIHLAFLVSSTGICMIECTHCCTLFNNVLSKMTNEPLDKKIRFLDEIDQFKHILRKWYTWQRRENDAEHTWHMCLYAMLLQNELGFEAADLWHTLNIILIHDLVEVYAWDPFCFDEEAKKWKAEKEMEAAKKLFWLLPSDREEIIFDLWQEYEMNETLEAKFAKTIDKLQSLWQNSKKWKLRQEKKVTQEMSRNHNAKVMKTEKITNVFERYYERTDWLFYEK